MRTSRNQFLLDEEDVPTHWYNILADLDVPSSDVRRARSTPQGAPADRKHSTPNLPLSMYRSSVGTERHVKIPDPVREQYQRWRPTPLVRAHRLEQALDTPAHIYYKYEGANASGSHKLNSALAQAYYYKQAGVQEVTTGTGAGQWGTALSMACHALDLACTVFMVRCSHAQKPYRKVLMELNGARVIPSPSGTTEAGRALIAASPGTDGSVAIANAEALEHARTVDRGAFAVGSGENHVLLHQTVIGEEALLQMELAGEFPDVVIGAMGAGSNFAGLAFPFHREKLRTNARTRLVAVEPDACPKMTRGRYAWDYNDFSGTTPMTKMYTLGHTFVAPGVHAGGLRYHGAAPLVSALYEQGLMEAVAYGQTEVFEAGAFFARAENLVPAPESAHAVKCAIDEAVRAREENEPRVILFNVSGHGLLDLSAYDQYLSGGLEDHRVSDSHIAASLAALPDVPDTNPVGSRS
ncbi:TrpB-like pyridoxal phosphate-dependent enzyme [Streptomyces sp. MUM 178J]|uniref:TrpB-like pyridoxal phosphate-dependent enzyme n=1 Tax=Streptomyces sp. MUM 178J TaxID=2791991 RepID=UPI001F035985|nr:TrpB-like pyridoxal phosphate-dependent enzyme [Streptomyces sp. MUM 178J]WRQ80789.1 TrpB-like pyridoxal phosphate-dependent enzyme [Streptomyces sp. MUM 178J]